MWQDTKVAPIVWQWFTELCRGEPGSIWHIRRIMRALDVRMKYLPYPASEAGPHARGKVIYIPRVRGKNRLLRQWLLHELAEIATFSEAIPPMVVPSSSDWDRHLVARGVEGFVK